MKGTFSRFWYTERYTEWQDETITHRQQKLRSKILNLQTRVRFPLALPK